MTYNGDEIGMPDNFVSWEETTDPQGCNAGIEGFHQASRDPARTPFLWDQTTSAGKSGTNKYKLSSSSVSSNVQKQPVIFISKLSNR